MGYRDGVFRVGRAEAKKATIFSPLARGTPVFWSGETRDEPSQTGGRSAGSHRS